MSFWPTHPIYVQRISPISPRKSLATSRAEALDGGADGLRAYRRLALDVARLLRPGGLGLIELGQGQAGAVAGLMNGAGLAVQQVRADLAGIERVLVVTQP